MKSSSAALQAWMVPFSCPCARGLLAPTPAPGPQARPESRSVGRGRRRRAAAHGSDPSRICPAHSEVAPRVRIQGTGSEQKALSAWTPRTVPPSAAGSPDRARSHLRAELELADFGSGDTLESLAR